MCIHMFSLASSVRPYSHVVIMFIVVLVSSSDAATTEAEGAAGMRSRDHTYTAQRESGRYHIGFMVL